ncbi:MAG: ATP-binding cassette domain-containing protein, partial [Lachnospiraceae bacterium]|nr:ATP-binding cassette domain-containing protein [Lachnospiraceae bacterium]
QLSGGERVRLALCKMFYTRPNFLILDEPTNHMDIPGKEALEKMLQSYTGTVLFVSHDRYFIREVATGILDFANGEVTQYPFGYDEYLREKEKRSTTEEVSKTPAAADTAASVSSTEIKNPGKFRARIERKIEKIQGQIAESEEKTRILQEQLANPALASDFEKLMEIQAEIDQNEKQQEDLLNLLVEAEEELTTL